MGTSLLPQLTVYGALLVAAAILGFWPELRRVMHSLRDLMVWGQIGRALARLRDRSGGRR